MRLFRQSTAIGARLVVTAASLLAGYVATAAAASCTVDAQDKCRCSESSGILLDVGCYFYYPYEFEGISDHTTYKFRFSPCEDTLCEPQNGSMCQYASDLDRWFVLGRLSDLSWTINSDNPLNFTIQYGDGEIEPSLNAHRKTLVTYVYSESSKPTIQFIQEQPQLVYHFQMTGRDVKQLSHYSSCGGGGSTSGGVQVGIIGLVILSLAIVGLVIYFIVGSVVNYKVKGARSYEIIPNLSFWTALPILIKDGFIFTFGICIAKCRRSSDYEKL